MLVFLKIRYCKARMVAYVNGELPPAARRRVARYIDQYPACYAEYMRQREAARELAWRMPLVGQPDSATLSRIWSAVQDEMQGRPRHPLGSFRLRYGVVGLGMAFAFALPLTFGGSNSTLAFSLSQPAPRIVDLDALAADVSTAIADTGDTVVTLSATEQIDVTPPTPLTPRATPSSTQD